MLEVNNFNAIRISLASPEQIRDWSKGEVTKPETINYRTLRPEKDGLFDERIFGPSRDWECYCGKYKRIRYKGIICDKCGVEVTRAKVRRERMGHIQLASPVSHIWYFKGTPSRLGILLDISPRNLEAVLYFAKYLVTWVDEDARARLLQQLDEEAEGRGKGGKALAEREDQLRAELNRQSDELNEGLKTFKREREEERGSRTSGLVEAQQAAEAAITALGSSVAESAILFGDQIIVAEGESADKKTVAALRKAAQDEVERVNTEIQEREAAEEAAVQQRIADLKLQLDAELETEKERLRTEADGLKEEIRKAKDEITRLKAGDLLPETSLDGWNFRELDRKYGSGVRGAPRLFAAGMGAEAVRERVLKMDMEPLARHLHSEVRTTSGMRRKKAIKRLRLIEAFRKSGTRPEWMILSVLPVIPPDLRPMVQLDGGRFATSDLNDLYRRVINRNNRLKRLLELGAPEIIIRNEKRMLQEACDALIDNGRRGRAIAGTGNHRLKSLSDMLKGKQGRFRQNLLGKRVDYSGRSVIVVGPELKLHQCGLPKKMALELFKPFVMRQLVEKGFAHNIKSAKRIVERVRPEVWDVLEEVIKDHPVLLNRAPTLHRLGIQAFMPVLVEGSAIQIHPLVCFAFNADFDGDQMAVHVPLSKAAQDEARRMMLSTANLLSPSDGGPVVAPTQDMILGCYYLTLDLTLDRVDPSAKEPIRFSDEQDALLAYEIGRIDTRGDVDNMPSHHVEKLALHSLVQVPVQTWDEETEQLVEREVRTTVGRLLFNQILPDRLRFTNETMNRARLREIVSRCYSQLGSDETAHLVDGIKSLGFKYATRGGMTIAVSDIPVPPNKAVMLAEAEEQIKRIDEQFQRGLITDDERYTQVVAIWQATTARVSEDMSKMMEPGAKDGDGDPSSVSGGSVWMMTSSGARGNKGNIGQLGGMRGLMADPTGRIIDVPVRSNFKEGMTVLEYFISTHGARKGLADTALRTADSGYLTRRLVDVAQDVITRDDDCGTGEGGWIDPAGDGGVRGHRARRVPPPHRRPVRRGSHLRAQGEEEGRAHRGARPGDRRGACPGHRPGGCRRGAGSLTAHLPVTVRRLPHLLRPQPGHRPARRHRRGGGHHRRAVHRRAGHPAHHAHVPYRRRRRRHGHHGRPAACRGAVRGPHAQGQGRDQPHRWRGRDHPDRQRRTACQGHQPGSLRRAAAHRVRPRAARRRGGPRGGQPGAGTPRAGCRDRGGPGAGAWPDGPHGAGPERPQRGRGGARVRHPPQRQAAGRERPGDPGRGRHHRRPHQPPGVPRDPRSGGGPALPRQGGPARLPQPGRDHQRQAHRDHRPADDAQGAYRPAR